MKLLKRILFLSLAIGVIWGFWGAWGRPEKGRREPAKKEIAEKSLRFVVMSDVHSDWKNFQKALETVKGSEGLVIITGDLTTIGTKNELIEAKKILDESGLRYYVIPGNHDVWWGRKYKKDVWGEVFGDSFKSFKEGETKFILINNGDALQGFEGVGGNGEKQMDWLKEETAECPKIYCLVFMHMPLNHPNSLHVMGEENPLVASEAGEIKELLKKNGVKEIFAGHLHFSSSYEIDGLRTTIVGAVTSDRNLQSPKFLEVQWEDGQLKKQEVFLTTN